MNILKDLMPLLVVLFGAGGLGTGLFFWRKYKAEVKATEANASKTMADTGKISADTIGELLTIVRDTTAGFTDEIKKLKVEMEDERVRLTLRDEQREAEREVERALWREEKLKAEADKAELQMMIRTGKMERQSIRETLEAIKQQMQFSIETQDTIQRQIRLVEIAVNRKDGNGPPSNDPIEEKA